MYPRIGKWFLRNPGHLILSDDVLIQFLQQKSIAASQLAGSGSRGDFIQQMEKKLQQIMVNSPTPNIKKQMSLILNITW